LGSSVSSSIAETASSLGSITTDVSSSPRRARRQERLQRSEATFEPLPFDAAAAHAYGRIYAAVTAAGRKARGRRAVDLLVAAIALARQLPLYTCNANDFAGLEELLEIVSVPA
jgi:predicted nucleic acid-binding protein